MLGNRSAKNPALGWGIFNIEIKMFEDCVRSVENPKRFGHWATAASKTLAF